MDPIQRLQTAHADALQHLGHIHSSTGGDTADLPGARLMASGLPQAPHNSVCVTDSSLLDLPAGRAWYADKHVPWGALVPVGMPWSAGTGRRLFRMRLLGLLAEDFVPAAGGGAAGGLRIRRAGPADVEDVVRIDCAAFGGEVEETRAWLEPLLADGRATVALAGGEGEFVGTAYTVQSNGRAGSAAYLAGVGVTPEARRRGVAAALSSWLVQRAISEGAELMHCHPDSGEASRIYERLGFVEGAAFDVWVDMS